MAASSKAYPSQRPAALLGPPYSTHSLPDCPDGAFARNPMWSAHLMHWREGRAASAELVEKAKRHAAASGGWVSSRHAAPHCTTDFEVSEASEILAWVAPRVHATLLPAMADLFLEDTTTALSTAVSSGSLMNEINTQAAIISSGTVDNYFGADFDVAATLALIDEAEVSFIVTSPMPSPLPTRAPTVTPPAGGDDDEDDGGGAVIIIIVVVLVVVLAAGAGAFFMMKKGGDSGGAKIQSS